MSNIAQAIANSAIDTYYKKLYGISKTEAKKKEVCVKCKGKLNLSKMNFPQLYDYKEEAYCPKCAKEVMLEDEVRLRVLFAKSREGRGYLIAFLGGYYLFFFLMGQNKDFAFATNSKESMVARIKELFEAQSFFTKHFFAPYEELLEELTPYVMGYEGE